MTITVTPVSNTQTFGSWLAVTNRLANLMSQNTVTADSTVGGSLTTGNVFINGHLGGNFLYVANGLSGGNVSAGGELLVISNTRFQYSAANLLSVTGNTTNRSVIATVNTITFTTNAFSTVANSVNVTSNTLTMNVNVIAATVNTFTITGNSTFANTLAVTGAATLSSTLSVTGAANVLSTFGVSGATTLANTVSVGGNVTFNNAAVIVANGSFGTSGQVLSSNGTGLYWAAPVPTGVTSVATGNGLTGGPITTTGTVSVQANNGITANSSGLFVTQGTGAVVNSTGVHVNSSFYVTLTANTTDSQFFYIPMSNNTSGVWSNGVVSTTKLYFVPSTGDLYATNFNSLSDASKKKNIKTLSNALDIVMNLKAVEFEWIDNGDRSMGVIAQELEQVLPDLVQQGNDNTKSVNYIGIIAYLIGAVQEQQHQINMLKSKLEQ